MAETAKGQPDGLATLDSTGKIPNAQLPDDIAGFDQGAAVADVATADADVTYGAEEQALINETKTKFNQLLVSLRDAGIIAT